MKFAQLVSDCWYLKPGHYYLSTNLFRKITWWPKQKASAAFLSNCHSVRLQLPGTQGNKMSKILPGRLTWCCLEETLAKFSDAGGGLVHFCKQSWRTASETLNRSCTEGPTLAGTLKEIREVVLGIISYNAHYGKHRGCSVGKEWAMESDWLGFNSSFVPPLPTWSTLESSFSFFEPQISHL